MMIRCLFYLFGGEFQGAVRLPRDYENLTAKGILVMVEDARGVKGSAFDPNLEMKMVGGGSARPAFYADRLTRLQPLANLDKVAGIVAVECLQTIRMTQDNAIPISIIRPRKDDLAREGCTNRVPGTGLDVCTSVTAPPSIGTDEFASGQGIAPFLLCVVGKVNGKLVTMNEGVFGRLHPHHLPLVDVNRVFILSEGCPTDSLEGEKEAKREG